MRSRIDAVEHDAPGNARDAGARRGPGLENGGAFAAAGDVEPDTQPPAAPGDEVEVEPDHVPPEDEVRIVLGDPREEAGEEGGFVRGRLHRHVVAAHGFAAHHQHPLVLVRVERHREESAVEARRLDVERDPAQLPAVRVAPNRGVAHLEVAGLAGHVAARREPRRHEALHQETIARFSGRIRRR